MDVEARLLLYSVALGAVFALATLVRRRSYVLWVHMLALALMTAVSAVGLMVPSTPRAVATWTFVAFLVLAIAPYLLLWAARRSVGLRRPATATRLAALASGLLGFPAPFRREAALYGALAAGERGDERACASGLARLAQVGAIPEAAGGALLARVLPPASARRWRDVLAVLDDEESQGTAVLVIEARAAAEQGDLGRALRACDDLGKASRSGSPALSQARRAVLAAAGRAAFLEDAAKRRLPVMATAGDNGNLALARAHEASGDLERAATLYRAAADRDRGSVVRDAQAGLRRIADGTPRRAEVDVGTLERVETLQRTCGAEPPAPPPRPLLERAPFTVAVSVVTTLASALAWFVLGQDAVGFLASGALSAPLIVYEGQWWRLFTAMLLHVGSVHLLFNVASILLVGIALESRIGPARTACIYVLSGLVASVGSVYLNWTEIGVGASGAAMGLFGGFLVLLLMRKDDFEPASRIRWIKVLVVTLVATAAIGAAEYRAVDNAAHGAGAAAGMLVAWLVIARWGKPWVTALARRVCAALLLANWALATVLALGVAPGWSSWQEASGGGVVVELPGYLRLESAETGGVLARRAPLGVAVHFGRDEDAQPDPSVALPPGAGLVDPGENGDRASYAAPGEDPPRNVAYRDRVFRRDGVFALVVVPAGPEAPEDAEAVVERIGRSLRAAGGTGR